VGLNYISAAGFAPLASVLPRLPCFRKLIISGNTLGYDGLRTLASAIPASLAVLKVAYCSLGASDAATLADAIVSGRLRVLTKLDISRNDITGAEAHDAVRLIQALRQTPLLTDLNVGSCAQDDSVAAALASVLPNLPSLVSLQFNDGSPCLTTSVAILAGVRRHTIHTQLKWACITMCGYAAQPDFRSKALMVEADVLALCTALVRGPDILRLEGVPCWEPDHWDYSGNLAHPHRVAEDIAKVVNYRNAAKPWGAYRDPYLRPRCLAAAVLQVAADAKLDSAATQRCFGAGLREAAWLRRCLLAAHWHAHRLPDTEWLH
jgi:hypothetical protein